MLMLLYVSCSSSPHRVMKIGDGEMRPRIWIRSFKHVHTCMSYVHYKKYINMYLAVFSQFDDVYIVCTLLMNTSVHQQMCVCINLKKTCNDVRWEISSIKESRIKKKKKMMMTKKECESEAECKWREWKEDQVTFPLCTCTYMYIHTCIYIHV